MDAVECPVVLVDVVIGKYLFITRCGIVSEDFINTPIGHNLPGIDLEDLLADTRPKNRKRPKGKESKKEPTTTPPPTEGTQASPPAPPALPTAPIAPQTQDNSTGDAAAEVN